jgi:uncharacterized protein YyaL (SSP411 family)
MPNSLAAEKSPYLRQHADNPVDWMPWGEAAFAKARAEQKPIFLSIGYSTCHWCHVMAHESFENPAIAALLNQHFVPVKVDREERPDVDKVYMSYVQAMTGHGGWPLSAWLTPELKPFFGGTYFPPEDRHGRAGFPSLLQVIARGWEMERDKLVAEGDRVLGTLREYHGRSAGAAEPSDLVLTGGAAFEKCFQHFYESFDPKWGGFGGAPKFPRATNFNFLFRVAAVQGAQSEVGAEAVKLATATLRAMAQGGLHDHVGGGFHRYSVDEQWFVPHFEKMLYDQAQLAVSYLEARQATGNPTFGWVAHDILDYVQRDLTHPAGGFYTAEDADSLVTHGGKEHAEGAFYVWGAEELRALLGEDYDFCAAHFGVLAEGNVGPSQDPQGEFRGKNILRARASLGDTATKLNLTPETAEAKLLAVIARLQVATRAVEFIRRELYDESRGVLYRSWLDGRGTTEGFAEDYACLVQGLLDLYEAGFDVRWLQWAVQLQATMDREFWDEAGGGYFNSRADDKSLVLRLKEDYDGAEPAPSSLAAMNLLRLEAMVGGDQGVYRNRALQTIEGLRPQWERAPQALPQMVCAIELALATQRHVVLAGDPAKEDFRALAKVLHEELGPRQTLLAADGAIGQAWLGERLPWVAPMQPLNGRATAYVCQNHACQAPVSTPTELRSMLTLNR